MEDNATGGEAPANKQLDGLGCGRLADNGISHNWSHVVKQRDTSGIKKQFKDY